MKRKKRLIFLRSNDDDEYSPIQKTTEKSNSLMQSSQKGLMR